MRTDSRREINRILATYRKDWPFLQSQNGKLTVREILLGFALLGSLILAGMLGILD